MTNETSSKIPNHIAILPDGDRRWARKKGLPDFVGHQKGAENLKGLVKKAGDLGIHTLTFWGFSTENWKRSPEEVAKLMEIFHQLFDEHFKEAIKNETRIIHLGRKDRLPETLLAKINKVEDETSHFTKHALNIALDYGGHFELISSIEKLVPEINSGKISFDDLRNNPESLEKFLYTCDQPYPNPDLIIRTSGEQRLSGFMSWQCAYSEFAFPKVDFPDFTPEMLEDAVNDFMGRERRFGGNATPSK